LDQDIGKIPTAHVDLTPRTGLLSTAILVPLQMERDSTTLSGCRAGRVRSSGALLPIGVFQQIIYLYFAYKVALDRL